MKRIQLTWARRLLALGLLWLTGCASRQSLPLVTAQRVEIPVCATPPPPQDIPRKPDLPVEHLREDMEAAEVVLAYRQTVVLLEGWGEALQTILEGYHTSLPTGPEHTARRAPQPPAAPPESAPDSDTP